MTRQEACRVLGVSGTCETGKLKKRYRQLLHLVHPDAAAFRSESRKCSEENAETMPSVPEEELYPYGIHEIQKAYAVLTGAETAEQDSPRSGGTEREDDPDAWIRRDPEYAKAVWDAEENPDAFCDREILQNIEDIDGHILGTFTLIRGKFLWNPEEEFHLFLQSITKAVGKLLQDTEDSAELQAYGENRNPWEDDRYAATEADREMLKLTMQKQLIYLLAQQYIDAANTLDQLVQTQKGKNGKETIYYIPSMLETAGRSVQLAPGETLLPHRVEQHRLFVKNDQGEPLGYLSFPDDRMYYLVVPLFEQKRVQVKIRVYQSEAREGKLSAGNHRYGSRIRIRLWLRFKSSASGSPENISSQIRELLEEYRKQLLQYFGK